MTEIMPDFRAFCKHVKLPSHNDLDQDYPIKLPTQTHDEPFFSTGLAGTQPSTPDMRAGGVSPAIRAVREPPAVDRDPVRSLTFNQQGVSLLRSFYWGADLHPISNMQSLHF